MELEFTHLTDSGVHMVEVGDKPDQKRRAIASGKIFLDKNTIQLIENEDNSDGVLTPIELIDRAHDNGVSVLSIADHDTLGAYEDESTFEQAKKRDIRLIPGVEISAKYQIGRAHV